MKSILTDYGYCFLGFGSDVTNLYWRPWCLDFAFNRDHFSGRDYWLSQGLNTKQKLMLEKL